MHRLALGLLLGVLLTGPAYAANVADVGEIVRPAPIPKERANQACPEDGTFPDAGAHVRLFGRTRLCVGGSLRLRYEWSEAPELGEAPEDGSVFLHRTMVHADLRLGEWARVFVEWTAASAVGRAEGPSPVDADQVDAHQAFAEVRWAPTEVMNIGLRAGRLEVALGSGRLIDVREGPNVRRPFEGGKLDFTYRDLTVHVMGLRAVRPQPGTLDNSSSGQPWLWGAYATWRPDVFDVLELDAYYLGYLDDDAAYAAGAGRELRHSVGTRLHLRLDGFDTNVEAVVQFGEFREAEDILAWTVASNSGYRFDSLPLRPRLGLSVNAASGDSDPNDGRLETFNALYPRGNYFGQLVLLGPANFVDVHPFLTLTLMDELLLSVDWEMFWRFSTEDAVYGVNRSILREAETSSARFVAHILSFALDWQITRNWAFFFTYGQVFEGTFVADGGGEGTTRLVETSLVFAF